MSKSIEYTGDNGFKGVLYGKSSFSIYNKNGLEVFHTVSRKINSYEELIKEVEQFPRFLKLMKIDAEQDQTEQIREKRCRI